MSKREWVSAGIACFFPIMTIFTGGCVTPDKEAELKQTSPKSSFAEEQVLGEKMIKALRDDDAAAFIALLHKDTRARFGKKEFAENRVEVKKLFGEIVSFQYLTALEMPTLHPLIWKIRFRREARQKNEPAIDQEALFRIVFGRLDGKLSILSFGFL